jgi:hypothetical protein
VYSSEVPQPVTSKAGLTNGAYNRFDVSNLITGDGSYAMVITDNNSTNGTFHPRKPPAANRHN